MSATTTNQQAAQQELVITRTFNAPRELVFNVWTQPEHLAKWWGPKGMENKVHKHELRKGGIFHYSMEPGNGQPTWWGRITYDRIDPHEYLDFIVSFSDEKAGLGVHPLSADWPKEVMNNLHFTEENGKTTVVMRGYPLNATDAQNQLYYENEASVEAGTKAMLNVLDEYLESLTK